MGVTRATRPSVAQRLSMTAACSAAPVSSIHSQSPAQTSLKLWPCMQASIAHASSALSERQRISSWLRHSSQGITLAFRTGAGGVSSLFTACHIDGAFQSKSRRRNDCLLYTSDAADDGL